MPKSCIARYLNHLDGHPSHAKQPLLDPRPQVEFQQAASSVANLSGVTLAILGQAGADNSEIGTGGNCALSTLGLNWHEASILVV